MEGWRPTAASPDGGPHEYAVEYLLDRRGSGTKVEYLVKWKGAPESRATWEPVAHLAGCKELVRAFNRSRRCEKLQRKTSPTTVNNGGEPPPLVVTGGG